MRQLQFTVKDPFEQSATKVDVGVCCTYKQTVMSYTMWDDDLQKICHTAVQVVACAYVRNSRTPDQSVPCNEVLLFCMQLRLPPDDCCGFARVVPKAQ